MTFPEDCLQSMLGGKSWWVQDDTGQVTRGALLFAFAPHVDQLPYTFEPVGRTEATRHDSVVVKVAPLKVDHPLKPTELPVAAMSLHQGEVWAAYRAKKRPCLVLGCDHPTVDSSLTQGMPKNSTAPTLLIAPYYGAAHNNRAGYRQSLSSGFAIASTRSSFGTTCRSPAERNQSCVSINFNLSVCTTKPTN